MGWYLVHVWWWLVDVLDVDGCLHFSFLLEICWRIYQWKYTRESYACATCSTLYTPTGCQATAPRFCFHFFARSRYRMLLNVCSNDVPSKLISKLETAAQFMFLFCFIVFFVRPRLLTGRINTWTSNKLIYFANHLKRERSYSVTNAEFFFFLLFSWLISNYSALCNRCAAVSTFIIVKLISKMYAYRRHKFAASRKTRKTNRSTSFLILQMQTTQISA